MTQDDDAAIRRNPDQVRAEDFLEPSPFEADGGEQVGKDPRTMPREILALNFREQNPLSALRAKCLDCCCGQPSEVRKCVAVDCRSWPFRMGTNPFRQKRELTPEQKAGLAERLAKSRSST